MNREQRARAISRKNDDFSLRKIYLCPVCNNALHVQAGNYQRVDRQMLGVIIECGECDVTMALDYGIGE